MAKGHYQVLARKWRPQLFESVIGQEHITRSLQNAIAAGRIGHAFLFIGSRGIGKTTTARILSKALNCLSADVPTANPCGTCANCASIAAGTNIDVIEIDGASNNSVDDVRQIRDNVRLVPSGSRYKIYVIDEVHQLSSSAFNALLKTLEEPPAHAVFILATTEAHKVPATIVSRCQRYDFRRVGRERIVELLRRILDEEQVACGDEALLAIAQAADGGIRDAESVLEQLISYCGKEITFADVFDVLGLVDWEVMNSLCDALLDGDIAKQLMIVEDIVVAGKDLSQFVQDIIRYFRNLLVCKTADPKALLGLPDDEIEAMRLRANRFSLTELIRLVEQFAELSKDFDSQLAQRFALETAFIRISKVAVEVSVDTVIEKLVQLGAGGVGFAGGQAAKPLDRPRPAARPREELPRHPKAAPEPAEAPARESEPEPADERLVMSDENLRVHWETLTNAVGVQGLNLGIAFGNGCPVALDGDTVVIRFTTDHRQSQERLEEPENRVIIEAILGEKTANIARFRTEVQGRAVREEPDETVPNLPVRRGVNPKLAQKALENPHVAKIVDVFKGRIVDIKKLEPPKAAG